MSHSPLRNAPDGATEWCDSCQQYCGGTTQCACCAKTNAAEAGVPMNEDKDETPQPQATGQEPGDRGATTAAQDKELEKTGDEDPAHSDD